MMPVTFFKIMQYPGGWIDFHFTCGCSIEDVLSPPMMVPKPVIKLCETHAIMCFEDLYNVNEVAG